MAAGETDNSDNHTTLVSQLSLSMKANDDLNSTVEDLNNLIVSLQNPQPADPQHADIVAMCRHLEESLSRAEQQLVKEVYSSALLSQQHDEFVAKLANCNVIISEFEVLNAGQSQQILELRNRCRDDDEDEMFTDGEEEDAEMERELNRLRPITADDDLNPDDLLALTTEDILSFKNKTKNVKKQMLVIFRTLELMKYGDTTKSDYSTTIGPLIKHMSDLRLMQDQLVEQNARMQGQFVDLNDKIDGCNRMSDLWRSKVKNLTGDNEKLQLSCKKIIHSEEKAVMESLSSKAELLVNSSELIQVKKQLRSENSSNKQQKANVRYRELERTNNANITKLNVLVIANKRLLENTDSLTDQSTVCAMQNEILVDENNRFRKVIDSFDTHVAEYHVTNKLNNEKLIEYECNIEKLLNNNISLQESVTDIKSENLRYIKSIEDLKLEIMVQVEELNLHIKEKELDSEKIEILITKEEKVNDLQSESISQLEKDKTQLSIRNDTQDECITEYKQQISNMQDKNDQLSISLDGTEKKISDLYKSLHNSDSEIIILLDEKSKLNDLNIENEAKFTREAEINMKIVEEKCAELQIINDKLDRCTSEISKLGNYAITLKQCGDDDLTNMKNKHESLTKTLTEKAEELDGVNNEMRDLKSKIIEDGKVTEENEEILIKKDLKIFELFNEIENKHNAVKETNKKVLEHEITIASKEKNNEKLMIDLDNLRNDFNNKKVDHESNMKENKAKSLKSEELLALSKKDKKLLEKEMTTLNEKLEALECDYCISQDSITEFKTNIAKMEKEVTILNDSVDLLNNTIEEKLNEIESLSSSKKSINDELEKSIAVSANSIEAKQGRIVTLEIKLKSNSDEIHDIKEDMKTSEQKYEQCKLQYRDLNNMLENCEHKINSTIEKSEKYNGELNNRIEIKSAELEKQKDILKV